MPGFDSQCSVRRSCEHMFVKPEERTRRGGCGASREWPCQARSPSSVGVSKASVSLWVRDIELTPEQEAALLSAEPGSQRTAARYASTARERCRERRIAAQQHGRELARARRPGAHRRLHALLGGGRRRRRNVAQLVNADADLLGDVPRVPQHRATTWRTIASRSRSTASSATGSPSTRSRSGGSTRLGLPRDLPAQAPSSTGPRRRRSAARATSCRTGRRGSSVHSTFIVQSIYGAIQEYAGIDRPEWLDL